MTRKYACIGELVALIIYYFKDFEWEYNIEKHTALSWVFALH